jgi:hypothetical protein
VPVPFVVQDALVTKFQERVAGLKMPPSAKTVFDEELEKLQVRGADRCMGCRGEQRDCRF